AILAAAKERDLPTLNAEDARAIPGQGIIGVVDGATLWVGNRRLVADMVPSAPREIFRQVERLESEGKTVMFVGGDRLIGLLAVVDRLRPGAAAAIRTLKENGVERIVMLTGDNHRVAAAVAEQAGVDE